MTQDPDSYLVGMCARHVGILTEGDRARLDEVVVCGAGAGGVGGWTYDLLARLGCRRFRIADPEAYDPSNANRQAGCDRHTIGRNKAEVTRERILSIHPRAEVALFPEGVTADNMAAFLDGGGFVIDGVDLACLEIKRDLFHAARARGIPVITCPILGFGAALAVFHPTRSPSFDEFFGAVPPRSDPERRRRYVEALAPAFFSFRPRLDWPLFRQRILAGTVPSLGIATMLSGALGATAAVALVCGKGNLPVVPTTMHIDLLEQRAARTGPVKRWFVRRLMGAAFWRLARSEPARAGRSDSGPEADDGGA